jgi:hypothetical protein
MINSRRHRRCRAPDEPPDSDGRLNGGTFSSARAQMLLPWPPRAELNSVADSLLGDCVADNLEFVHSFAYRYNRLTGKTGLPNRSVWSIRANRFYVESEGYHLSVCRQRGKK